MLPNTEFTGLVRAVMDAEQAAGQDRSEDGYEALLAGLRRAETAKEMDEEWAPELVRCWQLAVDEFCRRHDLVPGLPPIPPLPSRPS